MNVEQAPGRFEVSHRDPGQPAPPADACLSRGITVGHDGRAHARAIRDVIGFLRDTFARR